jgi:hypothetical protein
MMGCGDTSQDNLDNSENLISSPRNVVQALTLDVPWTCWQTKWQGGESRMYASPIEALKAMKKTECENRELNAQYPQQTKVTVVMHLAEPGNDTTLYLRFVPLYFSASTIGKAAQKMLNLGGFPASLDTAQAVIESASGRYTARKFLQAIRTNTPLVVFLPMKIKGQRLTPVIYQSACGRVR